MIKAFRGLALAAALMPLAAQAQYSDSYNFLKAVRDKDGAKATSLVQKPGTTIIDTRDSATGEGALHIVAKRRDLQWLAFLLKNRARPDLRDNQGNTPVMVATQLGWSDGVSLLAQVRANVDLTNNLGETPLIRAIQNHDLPTVRVLLMAGADPNKRDTGSGLSARELAQRDPRAQTILRAIEDAKPRPKAVVGPN